MSVNKAILLGRLGKDPELKSTQGGKSVCTFTLATSEQYKKQDGTKQEDTTWHNILVWGRQAEVINEYLAKGREVYIEGRISNRSYDDKEGNKKYISEVVVQNFEFVGGKSDQNTTQKAEPVQNSRGGGPDDDLPF